MALAEKVDIYRQTLGPTFDMGVITKHVGTKYSAEAVEYFQKAEENYKVLQKLNDGSYIVIEDGRTELFGEAYRILDGEIELICRDGENRIISEITVD